MNIANMLRKNSFDIYFYSIEIEFGEEKGKENDDRSRLMQSNSQDTYK